MESIFQYVWLFFPHSFQSIVHTYTCIRCYITNAIEHVNSSNNASELYLGDALFESWPRHQLCIYVFSSVPPGTFQDRMLNDVTITSTYFPFHSTLRSLGYCYLPTYLLTDWLNPWLYGPLRSLAFFTTDAYSSLLNALCRHLLTSLSHRSLSTFSSHLNLGLPFLLFPSGLLSNIFLTILPWFILTTCLIHSNLFFLISATMSRASHTVAPPIPDSSYSPYSFLYHRSMYPS